MVSDYLSQLLSETQRPAALFAGMNYSLLAGGKRLRPVLCLATVESFAKDPRTALPAAAAIEMIHSYSLIHDDLPVMDDDDLRRGKPTNHKVFGEAPALLAGDALLTQAFSELAGLDTIRPQLVLRMVRTLADAAGPYGMVGGQFVDMEKEHGDGSEADLEFIHRHKTGKLIMASVVLGGLFADVDEPQLTALTEYGLHLGLAYQMVDDVLDVTATSEQLGKTAGKDAVAEKLTYPSLIGIEETHRRIELEFQSALASLRGIGLGDSVLYGLAELLVNRQS
ncbi:polyprenyl synthetase family protein [Alicyclobacillus sp. SO9]|nr:polyprenyl synthetase family protein [Alicyclobacillus sp. SO9]